MNPSEWQSYAARAAGHDLTHTQTTMNHTDHEMSQMRRLREAAAQTTHLANEVMRSPNSEAAFQEAFERRDVAYVESLGLDEEGLAEARYETMCGVNGNDSPFHSYFGIADVYTGRDVIEDEPIFEEED